MCSWSRKSLNLALGNFSKAECTVGIQSLSSRAWLLWCKYRRGFSALTITLTHVQTETFPYNAKITLFAAWPLFLVCMLTDRSFFQMFSIFFWLFIDLVLLFFQNIFYFFHSFLAHPTPQTVQLNPILFFPHCSCFLTERILHVILLVNHHLSKYTELIWMWKC